MTINEVKNYINNHDFYDMEDFIEEQNLSGKLETRYIENLDRDEHRWYVMETNVYEFIEGTESLGYLAISEVGTLKSEMMARADCGVTMEAYNVKKIVRESFEITNE